MSMTVVKGLQSEIFVPITPKSVWAPVTKPLNEMVIALATAAGVHRTDQERFNLAGDFTFREIPDDTPEEELMVTHGGYDNSDVNKDINCMYPISRLHERWLQKDSSRELLLTTMDSWVVVETSKDSPTTQVRKLQRDLRMRTLMQL